MPSYKNKIELFLLLTTAVIFLMACLVIGLLVIYQRRRLNYQRQLEFIKLDFDKNLLSTQIEIQEQTFKHISGEIHDHINLSLTLAKLNLNTMNWLNPDEAKSSVSQSIQLIGDVIGSLADLSKSMNTELICELGILNIIDIELNRIRKLAHLEVLLEIKGEPQFMDSQKELILFRIIQESLNNVVKYANATLIQIEFDYNADHIKVQINDNGIGFDYKEYLLFFHKNHSGIQNMLKRSKLIGGRFNMKSKIGTGTCINLMIPY